MKRLRVLLVIIATVLLVSSVSALEGEMAEEFAYLTGQTQVAMDLSPAELHGLLVLCDNLLEKASSLQGSEKKILKKRVVRLRGLFQYVIETKQAAVADEPAKE
jgi:hypothetical protein